MPKIELRDSRDSVVEYVRQQLIGPFGGVEEDLPEAYVPQDRYLMGKLYPVDAEVAIEGQEPEDTAAGINDGDEWTDSPISLAFQRLPASTGLSFFLNGEGEVKITVKGAEYNQEVYIDSEYTWATGRDETAMTELDELIARMKSEDFVESVNLNIDEVEKAASVRIKVTSSLVKEGVAGVKHILNTNELDDIEATGKPSVDKIWKRRDLGSTQWEYRLSKLVTDVGSVLGGKAELRSLWRPMRGGFLITVSLVNCQKSEQGKRVKTEDCLFQVGLEVSADGASITKYPRTYLGSSGDEEDELEVIYRDRISFAVGHGCSVEWDGVENQTTGVVRTEYLPTREVPDVSPEITDLDGDFLSLSYLSNGDVPIEEVCSFLHAFVDAYEVWLLSQKEQLVDASLEPAKARILGRIEQAAGRMRRGISLLGNDPLAHRVFCLANRAMLMQMVHCQFKKCEKGESSAETPDYYSKEFAKIRWRPFQLAFQLLSIDSVINEDSEDRDIVDLIWFPTGGGKTEAYLVMAAMAIFHRRLKYGEEGYGTAVLKRYTLRLLTSQQFERASRLICACEAIRDENPELGTEPITLGLWVGEGSSPNAFTSNDGGRGAMEKHEKALNDEKPNNFFSLTACPWCGTSIYPRIQQESVDFYGVRATTTSFEIFCPEEKCRFHNLLPVNVVDQHLYKYPPTFVVATIDKLARAAWDHKSRSLFGFRSRGKRVKPPSLIIQDELHLISGPLGTVAGIYECAFDVLMDRPKVIAATATIRRAQQQVRQLYGRDVSIFPPPGMLASDSFFSKEVPLSESPGRLYVGCMGQGVTAVFSQVQLSAAIALAPIELDLSKENGDGYWTQVIFHNSRRELGKTMTLAADDIPSRIQLIAKDEDKMRDLETVKELSANCSGEEIPRLLDEMSVPMGELGSLDILPCTNMLSVGVDIQRLGLMMVNGQPRTTAEYIQASSRVGRGEFPGLVFTHYSPTKPRDRSHYETFFSYHEALYRAVEPTSVTPFAEPALLRAIHAALVIVMRHAAGLARDQDAQRFNPNEDTQSEWIEKLRNRIRLAAPAINESEAMALFDVRVSQWQDKVEDAENGGRPLKYDSNTGHQFNSLICSFERKKIDAWPTLNSMRHVDSECHIKVLGEDLDEGSNT